jgi:hypothetical protein
MPSHSRSVPIVGIVLVVAITAMWGYRFEEPQQGSSTSPQAEKVLEEVRLKMKEAKRALARERKYSCCISPSCDFCAVSVGSCPCQNNLAAGKPVCHECKGGWHAGFGVVDGVKPEEVKTLPPEMNKMMYEARAKQYLKKR